MHRHLHGPSTAVRHGDCRVSRSHGPKREVGSLFTLVSHALGQNNKHSSYLHMPVHSQDEELCSMLHNKMKHCV